MQLPDNNMDDLFRKAAADYPLRTDKEDWDSVLGKLSGETSFAPGEKATAGKDYRRLLWLLLLLPLAGGGYHYFEINKNGKKIVSSTKTNSEQQNNTLIRKKSLPNTATIHPNTATANNITKPLSLLPQAIPANVQTANKKTATEMKGEEKTEAGNTHYENKPSPDKDGSLKNDLASGITTNSKNDVIQNPNATLTPVKNSQPLENKNAVAKENTPAGVNNKTDNMKQAATTDKNNIASKNTDSLLKTENKKKTVSSNTKEQFVYAGILGAIDASTVKLQSIKGAGYSLGLLTGYRFSTHWSVEAGISWDEKKYYTEGEYFNISKANIPTGEQLQDLNGNCNMFEIPLDAKYDFNKKLNGHFFITAGFSSYIMKKEAYNYSAVYYGQLYNGYRSYDNSSRDWFSIAQFSAGYEKQLWKKYNLRLEPYLKIPLQGIGIGSLPITSMGLNIGITRSLH